MAADSRVSPRAPRSLTRAFGPDALKSSRGRAPTGSLTPSWSRPGQPYAWIASETRIGLAGLVNSKPMGGALGLMESILWKFGVFKNRKTSSRLTPALRKVLSRSGQMVCPCAEIGSRRTWENISKDSTSKMKMIMSLAISTELPAVKRWFPMISKTGWLISTVTGFSTNIEEKRECTCSSRHLPISCAR